MTPAGIEPATLRFVAHLNHCATAVPTTAVCTVKISWWWAEELSETCRVLFQKINLRISASSWFYKNLSRCTVTRTSNCFEFQRVVMAFQFFFSVEAPPLCFKKLMKCILVFSLTQTLLYKIYNKRWLNQCHVSASFKPFSGCGSKVNCIPKNVVWIAAWKRLKNKAKHVAELIIF